MGPLKILRHICIVVLCVFVLAGIPILKYFPVFRSGEAEDAVSSASMVLPDQPSGEFIVLISTALHGDSLSDWEDFFCDRDFAVIFDDIRCVVAKGDAAGQQLAERYQAQLPENQMRIRTEDPTLLVSKAEAGYIDTAVLSREMADALKLAYTGDLPGVKVIEVTGGGE